MNPLPLSRREALRRILAASAMATALDITAFAADDIRGIGTDPNLLRKEIPWPRLFTAEEMRIVTALGDIIIPADEYGPAASAVGVPDFIDEWVSAPYEEQQKDLKAIRAGLAWIDGEAKTRSGKGFAECDAARQVAIVEDIVKDGTPARKAGYNFFKLFRDRVAGGYFSTQEGWKAIGYTGNVPLSEFPGPTPEALKHVGLA
ncbi:MAG: gluconate 2-dehydrogenase subunit 3 family protein [Chthoniobacteraceae bacterium]